MSLLGPLAGGVAMAEDSKGARGGRQPNGRRWASGRLGAFVKAEREARGWTTRDMAARMGVERSTISAIETGRTHLPQPENLLRLAAVLEVHPARLLERAGYLTEAQAVLMTRDVDDLITAKLKELEDLMARLAALRESDPPKAGNPSPLHPAAPPGAESPLEAPAGGAGRG